MLHHSAVCATLLLTDHDLTDHGDNAELYARCSGASVQTGRTAKMGIDAQHCTGRLGLYRPATQIWQHVQCRPLVQTVVISAVVISEVDCTVPPCSYLPCYGPFKTTKEQIGDVLMCSYGPISVGGRLLKKPARELRALYGPSSVTSAISTTMARNVLVVVRDCVSMYLKLVYTGHANETQQQHACAFIIMTLC